MTFNKFIIMAMLAASVSAQDRSLRVSRDLNKCPIDEDIELKCKVLLDGEPVGTVGSDGSIVLDNYDPEGCYNIQCSSNDDADSARIVWEGFVENARGETGTKTSNKAPYFLSGKIDGSGCTKLAKSCEDLDITVKAIRSPDTRDPNNFDGYICDKLKITCKEEPEPEPECVEFACAKCGQVLECYVKGDDKDVHFAKKYIEGGDFCEGSKTACGGQQCAQKEGTVVFPASKAKDTCPKVGSFQCYGGNKNGAGLSNWNTYKVCKGEKPALSCGKKCEKGTCDCKYADSLCKCH